VTGNSQQVQQVKSDLLARAFHDFDQAATVLQRSYDALTTRLQEMDLELAHTNASLREHLRETEKMRAHVTAVLESLDSGVIVTDPHGLVVRCNHSTERLLGIPQSQLRGCCATDILRELRKDHGEYPVMLPNGLVLALSQTDLTDETGALIGTLVLIHDVTRIRQLEDRLQRRNRLEAMGRMVGCIAHEIRNPLGSVELFASLLRKDLSSLPHLQVYAEHISVAVRSMDRLLANLLTYTRPDCSNVGWQETESLIGEVLTLASHAMSGVPIEVRRRLDPLVPRLWCDTAKMQQVLLNLVLNAVHAMPGGGVLTIAVTAVSSEALETPMVHIVVSDNGIGIAPAIRSRVFDPFFTTKDHGTGLGLAIVHALVEAHHGRIDVESSPGQGTSFVITLPQEPVRKESLPVRSVALAEGSAVPFRLSNTPEKEIDE
jgi:signal transduction histidine kinase